MDRALGQQWAMPELNQRIQDQQIAEAIDREQPRLRNFIRRRVADREDAEDILQEVFYELVEAYRMMQPVEHLSAWLFRVARNRIIDLFRRKKLEVPENEPAWVSEDGEMLRVEDMLPSPVAGPEALYARNVILEELDAALDELPDEQRGVFIAHELMGYTFKEIASHTGEGVNTLLSRKHYAVLYLRERLQAIYDEFMGK
jgi:RNA polymerase sigma factor (sigma-70 family)